MNRIHRQSGFSLMEMLIATGIMAVGLVMVATIFPVGVKLTTLTTERTTGAVAADEAFAKVQLYGLRDFQYWPSSQIALDGGATIVQAEATTQTTCNDFQHVIYLQDFNSDGTIDIDDARLPAWYEFQYPSSMTLDPQDRNYHWSALCRRVGAKDVQVTAFVNRKIGAGAEYYAWDWMAAGSGVIPSNWPKPVPVKVRFTYSDTFPLQNMQLVLENPQPGWGTLAGFDYNVCKQFFDNGCTIVQGGSGKIYRVREVDHATGTLTLEQPWQWFGYPAPVVNGHYEIPTLWVVPPAVGSDRYPCVGVYQKVIRFDDIN